MKNQNEIDEVYEAYLDGEISAEEAMKQVIALGERRDDAQMMILGMTSDNVVYVTNAETGEEIIVVEGMRNEPL